MEEWIIEFLNRFGYWGIMLLIAIENIFPPIPSEIILTFGGFMTTYTSMNVLVVTIFSTIGSLIGAVALYSLGRILKTERIEAFVERWGRFLRLKKQDIRKADEWFEKRGGRAVFFCRFVPIVRSLISIPAGITKMNMGRFILYTTVGTLIWNVVLVSLGAFAGSNWHKVAEYFDTYSLIGLIFIGAVGLLFLFCFFFKRKKDK